MTYKAYSSITIHSPFSQSTRLTDASSGQMDQHSQSWVETDGSFEGKAWVHGTIQSDYYGQRVLCPWAINESTMVSDRTFYGSCFQNPDLGGRVYMDDAVVSYASTVQWVTRPTVFNGNLPLVSAARSRLNVMRVDTP